MYIHLYLTRRCEQSSSSQGLMRCTSRSPQKAFLAGGHLQDGLLRKQGPCRCPGSPRLSAGTAGTNLLKIRYPTRPFFTAFPPQPGHQHTYSKRAGWTKQARSQKQHQEEKPGDMDLQRCSQARESQVATSPCSHTSPSLTSRGPWDGSGDGGTEEGKWSRADFSFSTSGFQVLPIFILPLSCFHWNDTNPPWNWLILFKPCLHGSKFHLVVLIQRPVSALWQERLLKTVYYKHML